MTRAWTCSQLARRRDHDGAAFEDGAAVGDGWRPQIKKNDLNVLMFSIATPGFGSAEPRLMARINKSVRINRTLKYRAKLQRRHLRMVSSRMPWRCPACQVRIQHNE